MLEKKTPSNDLGRETSEVYHQRKKNRDKALSWAHKALEYQLFTPANLGLTNEKYKIISQKEHSLLLSLLSHFCPISP